MAKKGCIPWNKGIKMSEEYCKKLSEIKKGKKPKNFYDMQKIGWKKSKGHTPWNKDKKGVYSKEILMRMSRGQKGNKNALGYRFSEEAKKKMSIYQRKNTKSKVEMRRRGLKGAEALYKRNPTSLEKAVYDFLVLKGIVFETQKIINGKFCVDAYIPSLNLVIEADGKYWHTLPRIMKKDKAENAYLTKCGYKMLRLSEDEINSGSFKERMVS